MCLDFRWYVFIKLLICGKSRMTFRFIFKLARNEHEWDAAYFVYSCMCVLILCTEIYFQWQQGWYFLFKKRAHLWTHESRKEKNNQSMNSFSQKKSNEKPNYVRVFVLELFRNVVAFWRRLNVLLRLDVGGGLHGMGENEKVPTATIITILELQQKSIQTEIKLNMCLRVLRFVEELMCTQKRSVAHSHTHNARCEREMMDFERWREEWAWKRARAKRV